MQSDFFLGLKDVLIWCHCKQPLDNHSLWIKQISVALVVQANNSTIIMNSTSVMCWTTFVSSVALIEFNYFTWFTKTLVNNELIVESYTHLAHKNRAHSRKLVKLCISTKHHMHSWIIWCLQAKPIMDKLWAKAQKLLCLETKFFTKLLLKVLI